MTDREQAEPSNRQHPYWPLADAPQQPRQPGPSTASPSAEGGFASTPPAAEHAYASPPFPPAAGNPWAQAHGPAHPAGQAYTPGPWAHQAAEPSTDPFGRPAFVPPSGPFVPPSGPYVPPSGQFVPPSGPFGPGPGAPGTHRPSGGRAGRRVAIATGLLGLTMASGVLGGVAATQLRPAATSTAAPRAPIAPVAQQGSLADVVAAVSPSVVSINVALGGGTGTGSGVIIDKDGSILTNAHVVQGASRISVLLDNGKRVDARLLGADPVKDVAVIRVDNAGSLTPAALATGTQLRVGDPVLAFGSPLGLNGSVTSGIVSSLNRQVEGRSSGLADMIQTDAAINPGNSGGPLVNTSGEVVGINTAIATTSQSGGNIGVGFAIPISNAMEVANVIRSR
jgi:putative serine protease PepD